MKIIQQTSTLLQFRERRHKYWLSWLFMVGMFTPFPVWRLWTAYDEYEFQYIQLKCEAVSSNRSEPCNLTKENIFTKRVESETVRSTRIYTGQTGQDEDPTTTISKLSLLTKKGDYTFPDVSLSNEKVALYSQKIDKFLISRRALGTQLESFTLEKDDRLSNLILAIIWSLMTVLLTLAFLRIFLIGPTYASWKFDKNDNSIVIEFHQFFYRTVYHNAILIDQVQKIKWVSQTTNFGRDEDGKEFTLERFYVELVLRSGEAIPLIPSGWSNYWTFEGSEDFITIVSHFLDIEVPELSERSLRNFDNNYKSTTTTIVKP